MNNLLGRSEIFFKQHGSTILTFVGAAGVIVTAVLAAKAAPKATKQIKEAEEEKGEKLTKKEIVQVAGPSYIPVIVTGAATVACVFGANVLNKNKQASLMSAYALIDSAYKEYREKVEEVYGEGSDQHIREEIMKDYYTKHQISEFSETKNLYYDEFSKRYFEATKEDILKMESGLNRIIAENEGAYLNEYYELLGLEPTVEGKELGWSTPLLESAYWAHWVEFDYTTVTMEDGRECTMIKIRHEPMIDFAYY